jgi:hypothetical protein
MVLEDISRNTKNVIPCESNSAGRGSYNEVSRIYFLMPIMPAAVFFLLKNRKADQSHIQPYVPCLEKKKGLFLIETTLP